MPNNFLGHGFVIGFVLLVPILNRYGIENRLYLFGEVTPYTHSDMNGYGHFVPGLLWSIVYWLCCGGLLGVAAIAFARRGTDLAWRSRWREARERFPGLSIAALVLLCAFVGSGSWFFYNAHVLNEFRTAQRERHRQAEYERKYKRHERLEQPKIIAVDTNVEIFPERHAFRATGHDLLVNHSGQPISDNHITDTQESVDQVQFDRPVHRMFAERSPSARCATRFIIWNGRYCQAKNCEWTSASFTSRMVFATATRGRARVQRYLFRPRAIFLRSAMRKARNWLTQPGGAKSICRRLKEWRRPANPYYRNINLFTSDSEWIKYHTIVSTSSDRIAGAPGYLKREWNQNGRKFFEYDMGDYAYQQLLFLYLRTVRREARSLEKRAARDLLSTRTRIQSRPHARRE